MFTVNELEEILPTPVRIVVCTDCLSENNFKSEIEIALDKYNKKKTKPVEDVIIDFESTEYYNDLPDNSYQVYIGDETVMFGSVENQYPEEMSFDKFKQVNDYFATIPEMLGSILDAWYGRIIELQEMNAEKISELEAERYYEPLYTYFRIRANEKAFIYLKKLARRYPCSKYARSLRRVYRRGIPRWHCKDPLLLKKANPSWRNDEDEVSF